MTSPWAVLLVCTCLICGVAPSYSCSGRLWAKRHHVPPRPSALGKLRGLHTQHDRHFVHKLLGLACLGHFGYRVWRVHMDGHSGLAELPGPGLALLAAGHGALSLTGSLFRVLRRPLPGQIIIYRETQLHTAVFTLRSLMLIALCAGWPHTAIGNPAAVLCRAAIVGSAHALADEVTRRYGVDAKLIRDIPMPDGWSDRQQRLVRAFYSIGQLGAIAGLLGESHNDLDTAFFVLLPIQLAAFLSTLVRKGLISGTAWHALYLAAILLVISVTSVPTDAYKSIGGRFAFGAVVVGRLGLRINKYLLWAAYAALLCVPAGTGMTL